jgi:hypothetical protein
MTRVEPALVAVGTRRESPTALALVPLGARQSVLDDRAVVDAHLDRVVRASQRSAALMDRRESPTALALVRVGCAVVLLCDQLWVRHVGLVEPLWSPSPIGFTIGEALASRRQSRRGTMR